MYGSGNVFSSLNNPDLDHPDRSRFSGVHYGIVEGNEDPLKLGRLQIRTLFFHNSITVPTGDLPWANYASPSGGIEGTGFYHVPPIGSQVVVSYVDGNPLFPVWLGTIWGAPNNAPESYVNTVDETNPYNDEDVELKNWDYREFTSLTTQGGNKFLLDDNLIGEGDFVQVRSATDVRRIELETPGDQILTLGGTSPFSLGSRILGQTSRASGLILADEGTKITLTSVRGRFKEGETVQDGEGNEAPISSIEIRPGYYLRLREDKKPEKVDLSEIVGEDKFRGAASFGTTGKREVLLDDQDETIRITTPDNHFIEINSKDDFIRIESEFTSFIEINDPEETIRIATPGEDEVELGYSILMDQPNQHLTIKGKENELYFKLDETGGNEIGVYNNFNSPKDSGVAIVPFYPEGVSDKRHVVKAYAGNGDQENGILWDRGSTSLLRPQAVYMYDDSDNAPTHHIRLISDALSSGFTSGRIDIGATDRAVDKEWIIVDPGNEVFVNGSSVTLKGSTDVLIEVNSGSASGVKIRGPWVSEYFNHQHDIDIGAGSPNNQSKWFVTSDFTGAPLFLQQLSVISTNNVKSGT